MKKRHILIIAAVLIVIAIVIFAPGCFSSCNGTKEDKTAEQTSEVSESKVEESVSSVSEANLETSIESSVPEEDARINAIEEKIKELISKTGISREKLMSKLLKAGFSEEEAATAIERLGVDFKEQAAIKAEDVYKKGGVLPNSVVAQSLRDDGFTEEEIEYAITALFGDKIKESEESQEKAEESKTQESSENEEVVSREDSEEEINESVNNSTYEEEKQEEPAPVQETQTEASEPVHEHTWVEVKETVHHDAEYQTIHHEEEGHYEEVVVQEAWDEEKVVDKKRIYHRYCHGCGCDLQGMTPEEEYAHNDVHRANGENWGWYDDVTYEDVIETIHHDAVTEQRWVVDKPAYDEEVLVKEAWDEEVVTGYKCSTCGAEK